MCDYTFFPCGKRCLSLDCILISQSLLTVVLRRPCARGDAGYAFFESFRKAAFVAVVKEVEWSLACAQKNRQKKHKITPAAHFRSQRLLKMDAGRVSPSRCGASSRFSLELHDHELRKTTTPFRLTRVPPSSKLMIILTPCLVREASGDGWAV